MVTATNRMERAINVTTLFDKADVMEDEIWAVKKHFNEIYKILDFIDDVREESGISMEELDEVREALYKVCKFAEKAAAKSGKMKSRTLREADREG